MNSLHLPPKSNRIRKIPHGNPAEMTLVGAIQEECLQNVETELHPKVAALVTAFVAYLKEPRYQNPLTILELASLFQAFFHDLHGLVFNIYAQLTLCKRQLIQNSVLFAEDPTKYDYLNAIANYSPSHIKLVKRSDPQAVYQLRVFAFYKAVTILQTIEAAHVKLFASVTPGDQTKLYYKIFRFDLRDLAIQDLLTEKLAILRKISLPLSAFCETEFKLDSASLDEYFLTLSEESSQILECIHTYTLELDQARTPASKSQFVVKIQKSLIDLCAGFYNNDSSKVSNDLLLPALIYILIYHPVNKSNGQPVNLYLNFAFVKNFYQCLDPHNVTYTSFNLNSSLTSYTPTERKETYGRAEKLQLHNFYELINLKESSDEAYDAAEDEFKSDKVLINYLQRMFFNTGELQYYLTNFEAILYFLINTPIKDIVPLGYTIPESLKDKDVVLFPLHQVLEARETKEETEKQNHESKETKEQKDHKDNKEAKKDNEAFEDEVDLASRSRSSSLFNTISSAVSQTVNRSRSNSAALKVHTKEIQFPSFEASLSSSLPSSDAYGLTPVKKFLGRLGQASGVNHTDSDHGHATTHLVDGEEQQGTKSKRSLSLFDVFSPGPGTRSGSADTTAFMHSSNLRKPTITTKLLNGVSELMTKLNAAANASSNTLSLYGESASAYRSPSREDSLDDCSLAHKAPPPLNERSSSMDKWFNNIGEGDNQTCVTSQMDSAYNDGSLFSASFEELTKYHHADFDSLTMMDLKNLKFYYDQLCSELLALKADSKTSNEDLAEEQNKEHRSI